VFLKVLRGDAGPTPESVLPRVENKVLAIWGEADQWTPVDSGLHPGTKLAANFPEKFELVRLPGVGHCPHDEAEEECHSILFDWLRTV
jgi:pimeloyl-ACP methyl ester carboxylesterase